MAILVTSRKWWEKVGNGRLPVMRHIKLLYRDTSTGQVVVESGLTLPSLRRLRPPLMACCR